jgi:hypothetical protein
MVIKFTNFISNIAYNIVCNNGFVVVSSNYLLNQTAFQNIYIIH